jgi:hypothetical protein
LQVRMPNMNTGKHKKTVLNDIEGF